MLEAVFSPLKIGNMELKNRLVVAPMVSVYCAPDGNATPRYIAYHEEKAKGGWGLIITEDYAVSPEGRGFKNVAGLWTDEQIPSHTQLPATVHKYGAKIFAQIYHCGRQTSEEVSGSKVRAPSAIPCPFSPDVPVPLTTEETWEIIDKFGDTALRAKKCGFDGVQIHGAHGYLIAEFMTPYVNKRSDEFGGPLQNRMKFPIEIIKNIRKKCGSDFVIDFRISGDEFIDGGRTMPDTVVIVGELIKAGLDMVHITAGTYASTWAQIPPCYIPHAWIAKFARKIKECYQIPVTTVGRINDPMMAESLLRQGDADLVAMGRASLCDPHFPEKAQKGEYDSIRRCIGCNEGCLGILYKNLPITCVLNPELGHEYEAPLPKTEHPRKIAIVGAGPAGLAAAIYACKVGHKVTVLEKEANPGGQFHIGAVPPCKGDLAAFINWQKNEAIKAGADLRFNTEASVENIKALAPDTVLVATGADPVIPHIPGVEQSYVMTAQDVLSGRKKVQGERMVVIGGGEVGAEMAHFLAVQLKKATIVEQLPEIIPNKSWTTRYVLLRDLDKWHVRILTSSTVQEIGASTVTVNTPQGVEKIPADTVLIAVGARSRKGLERDLADIGVEAKLIGDANQPGQVFAALNQAKNAIRNLG